jgi:mycothiol synthase
VPDVAFRRPSPSDLAQVRALCETVLIHDDEPGEIADLLVGGSAADRSAVAAHDGAQLVGVAAGGLRRRANGTMSGHLDLVAVHPSHQRMGVGRGLVGHVESWVVGRGAAELWFGNDAPTYAWPGVDHEYRAAHALAAALGGAPTREAINQTVDLTVADLETDGAERRLAAAGVRVERLDRADLAGVLQWVDSFGGVWSGELRQAVAHDPVGCHVARRGSAWVGFACHGANRRGWFGPMGTAESERGQGVGAVLLRRCLADQRAAGLTSAQIAWVGPVDFYARTVGAVVERRFTLYRKDL